VAKSRAQRKAEQQRRRNARADANTPENASKAQHDTQVPESADVIEAELAEQGANLDELTSRPGETPPPREEEAAELGAGIVPQADKVSRREAKRAERERRDRAKASEQRRRAKEPAPERRRGRVLGFFISCWAELKRVQWPDRETLIQASAVTLLFIAVLGAYLGALDAIFNKVVQAIL
jgi:preprotein translocase SecE subunit